MERYKELAALRCFTHDDMVQLAGSESSAVWQIKSYLQKGYIERVRRNLYAVISMETGQAIPNRYQIASRVTDDACVSHHSAFEYYGYANQVFYDVYFTTQKRVRPFSYDGVNYCPMACRGAARRSAFRGKTSHRPGLAQKTLLPRTVSTSASPAHSASASIGVRCPICRLWHRSFRISCWRKSWSWMQK